MAPLDRPLAPVHRTISYALRIAREREESETLLDEENQQVDPSGCVIDPRSETFNPHSDLPVYKNIHRCASNPTRLGAWLIPIAYGG
jgi:hypothetical protein